MLRLLSLSNAIRRTELHVFGRTFTSTTRVLAEAQAEASDEPAKKRFRGRNLYEFAQSLPENGLGFNIRPTSWREKPGCYYTLTDLRLKEFNGELKHGKAWGMLTWEGKRANYITRIKTPSPLAATWELYPESEESK